MKFSGTLHILFLHVKENDQRNSVNVLFLHVKENDQQNSVNVPFLHVRENDQRNSVNLTVPMEHEKNLIYLMSYLILIASYLIRDLEYKGLVYMIGKIYQQQKLNRAEAYSRG